MLSDSSSQSSKRSKATTQTTKLKEEEAKKKKPEAAGSASTLPSFESVVEELTPKLSVLENVVDLVMVSMAYLPDQMPIAFINGYKPISAAG
jgi:hypothetical protein